VLPNVPVALGTVAVLISTVWILLMGIPNTLVATCKSRHYLHVYMLYNTHKLSALDMLLYPQVSTLHRIAVRSARGEYLYHLGVESLTHLHTTVVQTHRAVHIDVDQSCTLQRPPTVTALLESKCYIAQNNNLYQIIINEQHKNI
jgi:hypothetical protein